MNRTEQRQDIELLKRKHNRRHHCQPFAANMALLTGGRIGPARPGYRRREGHDVFLREIDCGMLRARGKADHRAVSQFEISGFEPKWTFNS